jgi:hypothetical protein
MNRFSFKPLSACFFAIAFTFSFGALGSEFSIKKQSDVKSASTKASKTKSSNPWHFSNLYDESSGSFFIPYHLWSGAKWGGIKSIEKCMHLTNTTWKYTNARNKKSKGKITSPVKFTHPSSGKVLQTFEWKGKRGSQNLICHGKGMARIYDFRFEKAGLLDSPILNGTECKFPAGFGWKIGVSQDCNPKAPKQTTVTELKFDKNFNLVKMIYTYTEKEGFSAKAADDYYEYVPNKGRVLHRKLK